LQTRYLSGDGANQWLARVDSNGVTWFLTDHLGSVRDLMNASGSVIDHIDYDAFGVITNETNPSVSGRLKYTGYEWDNETKLYRAGARYYNSTSRRFMREDADDFAAGDSILNRYSGNGPTNGTDPSELELPISSNAYSAKQGSRINTDTLSEMLYKKDSIVAELPEKGWCPHTLDRPRTISTPLFDT